MLICPACAKQRESETSACSSCGFSVKMVAGIPVYSSEQFDISATHSEKRLNGIVAIEDSHFWFFTRARFVNKLCRRFLSRKDRILEVGSGSGQWAALMQEAGYNVTCSDAQLSGVQFAISRRGIKQAIVFDALRPPFKDHFDAVCAFDVLEHFSNPTELIQSMASILKPGGKALITVPAFNFLWNSRDNLEGHKMRYRLSELSRLFSQNGFKILHGRYFFFFIFPLLMLRALLYRIGRLSSSRRTEVEEPDSTYVPGMANLALRCLTEAENRIFSRLPPPLGGSIFLATEKLGERA